MGEEYGIKDYKVLKTERHCSFYLSSTTKEGLYTNPTTCKKCNGLNELCELYVNLEKVKEK